MLNQIMKILAVSDINKVNTSFDEFKSIIESENIDLIILLGGLFNSTIEGSNNNYDNTGHIKNKIMKSKPKISLSNDSNYILSLNWILKPVIVLPSVNDLKERKLLKKIQAQDTIWIRFLLNKSTIIDDYLFLGITDSISEEEIKKLIKDYYNLSKENLVILYDGNKDHFSNFNDLKLNIISRDDIKVNSHIESFLVNVDSLINKNVTIIDFDKKIVKTFQLKN